MSKTKEEIIQGLLCCQYSSKSHCEACPYKYEDSSQILDCTADLASDVIMMLDEEPA